MGDNGFIGNMSYSVKYSGYIDFNFKFYQSKLPEITASYYGDETRDHGEYIAARKRDLTYGLMDIMRLVQSSINRVLAYNVERIANEKIDAISRLGKIFAKLVILKATEKIDNLTMKTDQKIYTDLFAECIEFVVDPTTEDDKLGSKFTSHEKHFVDMIRGIFDLYITNLDAIDNSYNVGPDRNQGEYIRERREHLFEEFQSIIDTTKLYMIEILKKKGKEDDLKALSTLGRTYAYTIIMMAMDKVDNVKMMHYNVAHLEFLTFSQDFILDPNSEVPPLK